MGNGIAVDVCGEASGRQVPYRGAAGRVCLEPGCETRLSRYNPNKKCALHQEPETVALKRL